MLTDDLVFSQLLLGTALSLITGAMCGLMAYRCGRRPLLWFLLGFLFGLIGVFVLFFLARRTRSSEKQHAVVAGPSPWESDYWYFLDGERKRRGPFNLRQLASAAKAGDLKQESWVWNDQLSEWRQVHHLDGLPTELNLK